MQSRSRSETRPQVSFDSIVLPLHHFTQSETILCPARFVPQYAHLPMSPASSFYLAVRGSRAAGSPVADRRTATMLRDHYLRSPLVPASSCLAPSKGRLKKTIFASGSCVTSGITGLQALSMGPFKSRKVGTDMSCSSPCLVIRLPSPPFHLLHFVSSYIS